MSGFSGEQATEERIKARLIQNSEDFAKAIFEAEKHPYFSGQIDSHYTMRMVRLGKFTFMSSIATG